MAVIRDLRFGIPIKLRSQTCKSLGTKFGSNEDQLLDEAEFHGDGALYGKLHTDLLDENLKIVLN